MIAAIDSTDYAFQLLQTLPEYEILTCLPCGLVVLNAQGLIVWLNGAAEDLIGKSLTGAVWLDVIQQAFAPKADDGHEVSLVDGRRISVAISSLPSLPGELVTLTDLTTTREYEQAQANQQRLVSIGRMTAQLAHQIRTPLSSAMIYTDHLITHGFNHAKAHQWLTRIEDCHHSMEQQVKDLLLFARGDHVEPSCVNLYEWGMRLEQRALMFVSMYTKTLMINNDLPPNNYYLHAESLLGAVFNLISNALQAQANCIIISMSYIKNQGCLIQVTDDGCGMSDDVKAQVFTPFFTTKAQGTGLGLAVVKAVVENHAGHVTIQSSLGKGCCVTIYLPDNR